MKAIFAHNIRIKKDSKKNIYTHGSYSEEVWKRYLDIFDDGLGVIVREDNVLFSYEEAKNRFEPFNKINLTAITIKDIYRSIFSFIDPRNHLYNRRIISNAVSSHDCVIARLPSYQGFEAVKNAKRLNKKYIIEVVACTWDGKWNHSLKGKLMAPYSFIKMKRVVKNAPYVVYVTNNFLQNRYPTYGKSTNCSNVSLTEFDDTILEKRLQKINIISKDHKIIIGTTAAVNVRFKGQQYVIEALGRLKEQGKTNYEYQLVGGGDQTYLKSIAERYDVVDQVKFLGAMSHKKVFDWLETIDIYAQPSRQEGLPRALIEAMSRAVPAFGARTAGIPELLDDKYIFSNTKKNIDEICDMLKSFDKETMIKQAERNYEESKNYGKDVIEERRRRFFEEFKNSLDQSK